MAGGYEFAIQFFEGSNVNEEIINGQATEGRAGSMVKCGETLWRPQEEGACIIPVKLHMVLWKLLNTCG